MINAENRIVEEVPGVPDHERYFVNGPGLDYPYPSFPTLDEAKSFCEREGRVPYAVEPFEP